MPPTSETDTRADASAGTGPDRSGDGPAPDATATPDPDALSGLGEAALESLSDGLVLVDVGLPDQPVVYASPAFLRLTGYSRREVLGRNCRFLQDEGTDPATLERIRRAIRARESVTVEMLNRRKDGTAFWNELKLSPIERADGSVRHYVGLQCDVTSRRERELGIRERAHHDALTGLCNRALLLDRLGGAMALGGRRSDVLHALFVDLDGFKAINDTLGHRTGDELLVEAARRMSVSVRAGDTVARLGGDEFVVVVEGDPTGHGAATVADLILESLRAPFTLDGRAHRLSASIGIASWPEDAHDARTLLERADRAMYHAKAGGRDGFVFFHPEMNAEVVRRSRTRRAISAAIEREEFELHYQPVVELRGGRIVGAEALIRWRHPVRGLVGPDEFIPVAEETGQILALGAWVLGRAVHQIGLWRGLVDDDFRLAVNVSAGQLRDTSLTDALAALPDECLRRLELEITESIFLDRRGGALDALEEVRRRGARLSLDDFGTGYSSLRSLLDFPIDALKIDRSFVATDVDAHLNGALIDAIFSIARDFGASVVAEGIETDEQLAFVRARACQRGQGFRFARPMPADAFAALYERFRGRSLARPAAQRFGGSRRASARGAIPSLSAGAK